MSYNQIHFVIQISLLGITHASLVVFLPYNNNNLYNNVCHKDIIYFLTSNIQYLFIGKYKVLILVSVAEFGVKLRLEKEHHKPQEIATECVFMCVLVNLCLMPLQMDIRVAGNTRSVCRRSK